MKGKKISKGVGHAEKRFGVPVVPATVVRELTSLMRCREIGVLYWEWEGGGQYS